MEILEILAQGQANTTVLCLLTTKCLCEDCVKDFSKTGALLEILGYLKRTDAMVEITDKGRAFLTRVKSEQN